MHTTPRCVLLALMLLPLLGCSERDSSDGDTQAGSTPSASAAPASDAPGVRRDAARSRATEGFGIELNVDGQRYFFGLAGGGTGLSQAETGEISADAKTGRIDGQKVVFAEVRLANLRPAESTQRVGDGEPSVHILLSGVPGHDGSLRSLQGEVQVESLLVNANERSIIARFSGRFSAYSNERAAFLDPAHADAVEITGRLNTKYP